LGIEKYFLKMGFTWILCWKFPIPSLFVNAAGFNLKKYFFFFYLINFLGNEILAMDYSRYQNLICLLRNRTDNEKLNILENMTLHQYFHH